MSNLRHPAECCESDGSNSADCSGDCDIEGGQSGLGDAARTGVFTMDSRPLNKVSYDQNQPELAWDVFKPFEDFYMSAAADNSTA